MGRSALLRRTFVPRASALASGPCVRSVTPVVSQATRAGCAPQDRGAALTSWGDAGASGSRKEKGGSRVAPA